MTTPPNPGPGGHRSSHRAGYRSRHRARSFSCGSSSHRARGFSRGFPGFLLGLLLLLALAPLALCAQPLTLSHPHGLYDQPFRLSLSSDLPGARLFYTLDGSLPTSSSLPYRSTLTIAGTTVLRAVAIAGSDTSAVVTATYLFPSDVLRQQGTPDGYPDSWGPYLTISGMAKADYDMDPELTSDDATAALIVEGLRQLPIVSIVTDRDHLFSKARDEQSGGIYIYTGAPVGDGYGRSWERATSFELFGGPEGHDVKSDCGIRIHGGHGRVPEKNPKHSFRVVWRGEYGDGKLHYRVFGPDNPKKYNALILRTAFCNSWQHHDDAERAMAQYNRDLWARTVQGRLGAPHSEGFWAHLFLDGLYWGMYAVTERIDDDFCASHYGGSKEDWDVVKVEEFEAGNTVQPADGTLDKWHEMQDMASLAATSTTALYRLEGLDSRGARDSTLEPLLDIDNYLDYMILNQYGGNNDWDYHNWFAIRNRTNPQTGFRFLCWDSEAIFEGVNDNVLKPSGSHGGELTKMFATLMQNAHFQRRFADHVYALCAPCGPLSPDSVVAVWDSLFHRIDRALYAESARWGDYRRDVHPWKKKGVLYTVEGSYLPERRRLLDDYFPVRTERYLAQLRAKGWYPSVDPPTLLLDGRPLTDGDTLRADSRLTLQGDGTSYYTLDGTPPVRWTSSPAGSITPSAAASDDNPLLIADDDIRDGHLTVRYITKQDGEWSATATRVIPVAAPTDVRSLYALPASATAVYDLHGRLVAPALPADLHDGTLAPGLYLVAGRKMLVP